MGLRGVSNRGNLIIRKGKNEYNQHKLKVMLILLLKQHLISIPLKDQHRFGIKVILELHQKLITFHLPLTKVLTSLVVILQIISMKDQDLSLL